MFATLVISLIDVRLRNSSNQFNGYFINRVQLVARVYHVSHRGSLFVTRHGRQVAKTERFSLRKTARAFCVGNVQFLKNAQQVSRIIAVGQQRDEKALPHGAPKESPF